MFLAVGISLNLMMTQAHSNKARERIVRERTPPFGMLPYGILSGIL